MADIAALQPAPLPFTARMRPRAENQDFTAVLEAIVPSHGAARWRVWADETWVHVDRTDLVLPAQGWKLHVSATVANVGEVLHACAPVLLDAGCTFKVARDEVTVAALTSAHCPRGNAGKVLTVYPASDTEAVALAWRLDAATRRLQGPRILNDQPVREGGIVHYRYGVFTGVPTVSHDGEVANMLVGPDGGLHPDRREAAFTPPSWVSDPFREPPTEPLGVQGGTAPAQVLLDHRFTVREAIRHANRGGVFRGIDTRTGRAVVIKQARAHVAAGSDGTDARDRLRHEARVLDELAPSRWLPNTLGLFEQGGDLFLAEADLGGRTLRSWVSQSAEDGLVTRPTGETLRLLARIAEMVRHFHELGVVIRDLNPNNVLVGSSGEVTLVDPELMVLPGDDEDLCRRSGTPGYAPAEQFDGADPQPSMDLYALGAIALFCLTGEDPVVGADHGTPSIRDWLRQGMRLASCPVDVARLAIDLMDPDPSRRPSAASVVRAWDLPGFDWPRPAQDQLVDAALTEVARLDEPVAEEAIEALLERLLDDVRPGRGRVAPASTFGESTLATNVQHGAAGILGVLLQAWRLRGDQEALAKAHEVAEWLDAAVDRSPASAPVGLYFGKAGPLWALAEAGAALDDHRLVERSTTRALAMTLDFPGCDVTHGLAGLGLMLIKLWQLTGDDRLMSRVDAVAQELLARAVRDRLGIWWSTPPTAASVFAGKRYFGYAHGTAGIGLFLDHAARLTSDGATTEAAQQAVRTLVESAVCTDGRARWGSSPEDPLPPLPHWCNGSSGVATFLARAKGGSELSALLDLSARAVVAAKWHSGNAYCHGLAGNADTLLDIAQVQSGPYRLWASDLLRVMWGHRQSDARGIGLGDEPGRITPDFNVGYCGALSALIRLRHGGERLWLPGAV